MTRDDVQKLISEGIQSAAGDMLGITGWVGRKSVEHFQQFGEVLPVDQVVQATIAARTKGAPPHVRHYALAFYVKGQRADAAIDFLVKHGFDQSYGARPLKRVIQRQISDPVALLVLEGKATEGSTVRVDAHEGRLTVDI